MWTKESIAALPNIDLMYIAGDAADARRHKMNPYGNEAVAAMISECLKRGINTIFDDNDKAHPLSALSNLDM